MSSLARPSSGAMVFASQLIVERRLLPGLAYTLGYQPIRKLLQPHTKQFVYALPEAYLNIGAGEHPDGLNLINFQTALHNLSSQQNGAMLVTHMHEALMLGALEYFLREQGTGWNDAGVPVQGLSDQLEADFMEFYRYMGTIVGVPEIAMAPTSTELRTGYDQHLLELHRDGEVIDLRGARLFWELVLEPPFGTDLRMGVEEITSILNNGMYLQDVESMSVALPRRSTN